MVLSLDPIVTPRLTLPLWTAEDVALVRGAGRRPEWHADFPRKDDVDAASLWRPDDPWGPRSIVRGVTVLGSVGFFGPPDLGGHPAAGEAGEVEVGCGLVREAWGWGFATEALQGLLARVEGPVRATVRPQNARALRTLATCGFTRLRGVGEDGLVLVRPASVT